MEKATEMVCEAVSPCVFCSFEEKLEPYCQLTGRREAISCHPVGVGITVPEHMEEGLHEVRDAIEYRSCLRSQGDELRSLGIWWLLCLLLGSLACLGIRRMKTRSMTLYERRARA